MLRTTKITIWGLKHDFGKIMPLQANLFLMEISRTYTAKYLYKLRFSGGFREVFVGFSRGFREVFASFSRGESEFFKSFDRGWGPPFRPKPGPSLDQMPGRGRHRVPQAAAAAAAAAAKNGFV